MRTYLFAATIGLTILLGAQPAAWGQFQPGGNRTTPGGGGLGAGGGNPATGGMPTLSSVGTIDSSDRFVRGARQPGEFVGSDAGETAGFVGEVTASTGRTSSSGRASQTYRRTQTTGRANTGRSRGSSATIRTSIRLGFTHAQRPPAQLRSVLATRLSGISRLQMRSPVEVLIEGRTATLRGEVATEHGRVLAEQLARLEPGIWNVRNELVVAASSTSPPAETPTGPSAPLPTLPAPAAEGPSPLE